VLTRIGRRGPSTPPYHGGPYPWLHVVPLDQAIQLAKHWGEDHEIAEELAEVRSAKKKAISMLGAKKLDEAREILRGALEDEVEQANRAARQGQAWR